MKSSLKLSFAALFIFNSSVQALNPVQGFYAGIFLGGSLSPQINLNVIHPASFTAIPASLKYSVYGDIGGELGYRMNQFRLEGELFYNSSPYHQITLGHATFTTQKKSKGFRFKGYTNTGALMLNGYYDAYCLWEQSDWVPYVGAGIGYANIQNNINFYYNNVQILGTKISETQQAPIGQVILGLNYFMDDFTTFALDVRYFSTQKIDPFNTRAQATSLNFSFNGAFDAG